jgi:hypothetical protein
VPPHLFRDAAATTIAIDAPRNIADAHLILGHGTPAITEKHYIQARSISAGTRHQAMLADLRANLQTRETEETASCAP